MSEAAAERVGRELADRWGDDLLRMSDADLVRLERAVKWLGQERVFEIAEDQMQRRRTEQQSIAAS